MNRLINKYNNLSVQMKAAFWFLFCSLLQKGISVIVTPVFTRLMSTEQYGIFNVYSSWRDIFAILISLRLADGVMGPGLIKEVSNKNGFVSSVHGLLLTLTVCGAVLFTGFHTILERITGLSGLLLAIMVVQIWSQATFELWAKEQRISFHYRKLVALTVAVAILRPLLGILVVLHTKDKSTARIVEMAAVDFFAYIGLFAYSLHRGKIFYNKDNWSYALAFNIPLIPHFLSQTILNSSDRIMIERLVNADASGIYSLAYQISVITVLFNNGLLQAMSPWTFRKMKDHDEKKIGPTGFTALAIIAAINLLFIAFAPELVTIFAPNQYREAIWIIPPITMSVFFQFSYLLFADIELYQENTKSIAVATTSGAILNIVLNYIFINKYGYMAAGYTTLFCYFFIAVFHYVCMKRICKAMNQTPIYNLSVWIVLSCVFLVLGFALSFSFGNVIIRYLLVAIIFIVFITQYKKIVSLIRLFRK